MDHITKTLDDVAFGPVTRQPGDTPKIDARAWESLEQLGVDPAFYMLMHYEPSGRYGRLVAAFKNRNTRLYRRVSFGFSLPDSSTREPTFEPERDVIAAESFLALCEQGGMICDGLRNGVDALKNRRDRMRGGGV